MAIHEDITDHDACDGRRFVVLGNPENRRVAFFQAALALRQRPPAELVSYQSLLRGESDLAEVLDRDCVLRVDSPGENFDVERRLLALGAAAAEHEGSPFIPAEQALQLEFDRGLILHPRQWFLGYRQLLKQCGAAIQQSRAGLMNHPADIADMFDKLECRRRFSAAALPAAESLGDVHSYDELMATMQRTGQRRVFVKLAHGSSASGVVAFQSEPSQQSAITTAEMVRTENQLKLYNSLKLRCYTQRRDVEDLIDALCRQRVLVERWLPKAVIDGMPFDLRVVVIGGEAKHVVVRQSRGPLTNLHLGNRRGDVRMVLDRLGDHWPHVQRTCERVMGLFPRSLYAGVDVLILPSFRDHAVLEVNAFGDLLPGIENDGLDTYGAEVEAVVG